ncbi:MAG: hypothetical protein P1V97_20790 [Planctomycetota bacterium]|nr:hypothetical protein [Planctomycetota bacterium]
MKQEFFARPEGVLPKITARDLIADYRMNSENASIEYDGEWLRIIGRVSAKGRGNRAKTTTLILSTNNTDQSTKGNPPPIIVFKLEASDWENLQVGDHAVLEGRVNSMTVPKRQGNSQPAPEILMEYGILIKHIPHKE